MYTVYQVVINQNRIIERKTLNGAKALAEKEAQKDNFKSVGIVLFTADDGGTKEQSLGSIRRAPYSKNITAESIKDIRTGVFG